ncbi:MAG: hypothetical protein E7616_08390 [Ruminococcaceae bacterium]|nr:hypothetical protein [Oscillospiraceae bacterium]
MKNALRIISLMLTLIMCLGVFAACGKKDPTTKPPVDGDETEDWWAGMNYGGATIKFLVCDGDEATKELPSRSIWVDPEGDLSFNVNAAVNDRNKTVEKDLNVKIEMDTCEQSQTGTTILPSLTTGLHEYDVVGAYQYFDMGLTIGENGGLFVNYASEELADDIYLNVDQPWWDKDLYDLLSYGGCSFWITGDLSQPWIASVFVSYVNGDMWSTYKDRIAAIPAANGISDPFELVNQGLWTIDLWMEISKEVYVDSNANEKVDLSDKVGYLGYVPGLSNIMADALAAGAGIIYSTKTDDNLSMAFDNSRTGLFASKLYQLYNESNACQMAWDDNKYIMEAFADGNALLTVNQLHTSEQYLAEMTNFLVLPVPKLFPTDKYSTTNHDNITLYGIPKTTKDEGKLAAATATLERMGQLSYEIVTPAYYDNALKTRYTRYEEDMDAQGKMIDTIRESVTHDFAALYSNLIGNITWFFRQEVNNKNITTKIQSEASAWDSKLADVLEDIEAAYFIDV